MNTSPDELEQIIHAAVRHPLAVFILQIVLIILASQLCAFLLKKIGQPAVMGEIIAGILLGPSLLGKLSPEISAFIFPPSSLGNLHLLSQIGLILFMFVIGMELDMDIIRKKASATVFISLAGIILPYCLGIWIAYYLYPSFGINNIPFYAFALFMGIAMSITAFPVLARVTQERSLMGTRLGNISLSAAAFGDIIAWCLLAFVIAIARAGSFSSSIYTIVAVIAYIIVMLFVMRPLLKRLGSRKAAGRVVDRSTIAIAFIVLLLSAYCCEIIGVHALFGAFFAGVIMPDELDFRKGLIGKIEDVALVLLLPLFFVFTGLRTQIGLLTDTSLLLTCLLITVLAIAGKMGGSIIAARIAGENMKDSLAIGALMNTRGLVELVVLNIGYDLGIFSAPMFTILVVMALATTLMTSPLLDLINRIYKNRD